MKVYVAARFYEKDRVRKLYASLKEQGHTITLDWTLCNPEKPYRAHLDGARVCAEHAIAGVKECDVFIYLSSTEIGGGSSAELGVALMAHLFGKCPHIYVVGPHLEQNICFYHPAVQIKDSISEVLQDLALKQTSSEQLMARSE
jgi:hypothetical protein